MLIFYLGVQYSLNYNNRDSKIKVKNAKSCEIEKLNLYKIQSQRRTKYWKWKAVSVKGVISNMFKLS